jgi:hypothetical protein
MGDEPVNGPRIAAVLLAVTIIVATVVVFQLIVWGK